jgi:hypothetical protein
VDLISPHPEILHSLPLVISSAAVPPPLEALTLIFPTFVYPVLSQSTIPPLFSMKPISLKIGGRQKLMIYLNFPSVSIHDLYLNDFILFIYRF